MAQRHLELPPVATIGDYERPADDVLVRHPIEQLACGFRRSASEIGRQQGHGNGGVGLKFEVDDVVVEEPQGSEIGAGVDKAAKSPEWFFRFAELAAGSRGKWAKRYSPYIGILEGSDVAGCRRNTKASGKGGEGVPATSAKGRGMGKTLGGVSG